LSILLSEYEDPRSQALALVNKMIVIIWLIHCDCMLSVGKYFLPIVGVKRLRSTSLNCS